MRKLVREQRRLSRREKGSHNRDKQRIRVAKVHEKVTNQRNDFLQKQSTMLVCENQTICIEDLHVKGMIRNHKLAKSIASVSWAKFFEMLEYKAVWYGNEIRKVPTMYPSSQTCSSCGYRNPLVKNLRIRIWECPGCHAVHDRDTNAGINILKKDCSCSRHKDKKTVPQGMREQYKYSLWTPCKTLQYRKVFANAMVEETGIPLL